MADTVAALVTDARLRATVRDLPVPADLVGGGLGTVLMAGVCGSDVSLFGGGDLLDRVRPVVLGHENVVRVESLDPQLAERWGVRVGDRVLVEEFIPCGWCTVCRSGHYRLCPRTDFNGTDFLRYGRTSIDRGPGLWGGFAEVVYLHPDARLHHLPDALPAELAALATPVANGLRWVREVAGCRPGDDVVVLGPGAHGLGCVLAARECGAGRVALVGTSFDGTRLATGKHLGADVLLDADQDDVLDGVRRLTGGALADIVVDVTGSAAAAALAVQLAGRHGRVVFAGGAAAPTDAFPSQTITTRELTVSGVRGHDGAALEQALALLASGRHPVESMTTAPVPLSGAAELLRSLATSRADRPAHFAVTPSG